MHTRYQSSKPRGHKGKLFRRRKILGGHGTVRQAIEPRRLWLHPGHVSAQATLPFPFDQFLERCILLSGHLEGLGALLSYNVLSNGSAVAAATNPPSVPGGGQENSSPSQKIFTLRAERIRFAFVLLQHVCGSVVTSPHVVPANVLACTRRTDQL